MSFSVEFVVYDGPKDQRWALREVHFGDGTFQKTVCMTTFEFVMKDKQYLRKTLWEYIVVRGCLVV